MELSDDTFTVVITDDDADGEAVRELAADWHSQGLLQEFAIVSPAFVTAAEHGPVLVHASVVGHATPIELMRHLGSRRRRLIRLIVLHPLVHADSSAQALVEVCEQVATLVKRAMPMGTRPGDGGVSLQRINLLVPETDLAPQQPSILQHGWEVNAVVSPEDRPDLDRLNMFIRARENLHGHALAAAATVGGLWVGMGEAAFDRTELDSTTGADDVLVIRCQAKLIIGDDRAERMAVAAVSAVAGVPDGAVRYIKWGFVSDRPTQLVDQVLGRLLREPDWLRADRPSEVLTKTEVPLGSMIADWLRFQATLPLAAVGFFSSQAQGAVERGVTKTIVGTEAGEIGRVDPVTPDEAVWGATVRIDNLARALEPRRLEEDAATWGQSTPTAWRMLRELAIGLVDGSDLPAPFARQRRAELDEVLPPTYVVPLPNSGSHALRGVDVAAPVDQSEPAAALASAADSPASSVAATPEHPLEEVSQRQKSLLWQLASRVYDNRAHEQQLAHSALEKVEHNKTAPPTDPLTRARKTLVASWITSLVLLAVGALLVWVWQGEWWQLFLDKYAVRALLIMALAIVVIFFMGGHLYYRALRKYEWQVRVRLDTLRVASNEYVAASQQEKRWTLMYEGVLDWSDILAELLHRPWAELAAPEPERDLHPQGLPAAVALAVPAGVSIDPPQELVAEAVEAMCVRGWLRGSFDYVVSRSFANDPGRNGRSGDLPADLDLGLRELGPRADLLRTIKDPRERESRTLAVRDVIAEMVADEEIRTPPLKVRRIGEYSGGEIQDHRAFIASATQPATPFTQDVFTDSALVAKRHVPHLTALTVPPGVKPVESQAVVMHRSGSSLATRVDISQTLQPSEIKLFLRAQRVLPRTSTESTGEFN